MAPKTLLIIESPNLAPTAARVAQKVTGGPVTVAATGGHLYDIDRSSSGHKAQWRPERLSRITDLRNASKVKYDRVFIASDPDDEGERIAFQTRGVLGGKGERLRVAAWDANGFKSALSQVSRAANAGFDEWIAARAEARRIADRIIGWKYGSPGRVKARWMQAMLDRPMNQVYGGHKVAPPPSMGDFLLAASRHGVSIRHATDFLTHAWENGLASYPRPDGQEYGQEALALAREIARQMGLEPYPDGPIPGFSGSHEALIPLQEMYKDTPLLRLLREQVAHAIAREPHEIAGRDILPPDAAWLKVALRDRIGRPGTWSTHLDSLKELGAFDDDALLHRARVEQILDGLPDFLRDEKAHRAFEEAIYGEGAKSVQQRLESALGCFGIDDDVSFSPSWVQAELDAPKEAKMQVSMPAGLKNAAAASRPSPLKALQSGGSQNYLVKVSDGPRRAPMERVVSSDVLRVGEKRNNSIDISTNEDVKHVPSVVDGARWYDNSEEYPFDIAYLMAVDGTASPVAQIDASGLAVSDAIRDELGRLPAGRVLWVTNMESIAADRLGGEVVEYPMPEGTKIVTGDSLDGWLVVLPEENTKRLEAGKVANPRRVNSVGASL